MMIFMAVILLTACTVKDEWTEIRGVVKGANIPEINLYEVVDGANRIIATAKVDKDSTFGFLIRPGYEGFYCLGNKWMDYLLYLKGGEQVNVELRKENYRFVGKNTPENEKVGEWEQISEKVRLYGAYSVGRICTYKDFFPALDTVLKQVDGVRKGIDTSNKKFNEAFKRKIGYDLDYYSLMLLSTPRVAHPKEKDMPEYYKTIYSPDKFQDDFVLSLPYGVRLLNIYVLNAKKFTDMKEPGFQTAMRLFKSDRLIGEYLLQSQRVCNSYFQLNEVLTTYEKYLVTESLKERAEEMKRQLFKNAPQGAAIDFTYPDVNGKMVSLSDFKGKVVVVDVWATWCSPCRYQLPFLKKLEEEMRGKDVVFIGVSVDKKKDYEKWKKMLKDEGLQGVQLFADGFSKITKDYNITGIPRFMVFDKKGNLVEMQAPRPSEPALKKMIEAELKK